MKNLYIFGVMILLLVGSNSVFGEDRFDFKLRQHSIDKNYNIKPALIQYTAPKDKNASYQVDAAFVGTYAPSDSSLEISGVLELHKNTLVDKEQDTVSAGLMAGDYLFQDSTYTKSLYGNALIKYQKDNENDTESILAIFELSGIQADWYLNNIDSTSNFPIYWSPILGVEYENFVQAKENKEGDLGRLYGSLEVGIYPFFEELDGKLSATFKYAYWSNFNKDANLEIEDDSYSLRNANISFLLTPESKIKVSLVLSWFDGEDPRNKKPDQEYTQIGIGIKY